MTNLEHFKGKALEWCDLNGRIVIRELPFEFDNEEEYIKWLLSEVEE